MIYQINSLPYGWVLCPPLVATWIKKIKAKGENVGDKILFKTDEILKALNNLKVPHVADFIKNYKKEEYICFPSNGCTKA